MDHRERDKTRTGQDKTRTGQDTDKTRHDTTRQDRTGQDRTGQDRTGQDRTGQDRTGQDRTGRTMRSYYEIPAGLFSDNGGFDRRGRVTISARCDQCSSCCVLTMSRHVSSDSSETYDRVGEGVYEI